MRGKVKPQRKSQNNVRGRHQLKVIFVRSPGEWREGHQPANNINAMTDTQLGGDDYSDGRRSRGLERMQKMCGGKTRRYNVQSGDGSLQTPKKVLPQARVLRHG